MESECEERGYRLMRGIIDTLEVILATILAAAILIASAKLIKLMYIDLVESELNKTKVLEILDMILLLLLAIDILRTLLTAVVRRRFPIRIVIEAAMLAVLREIISVEIRHLDWSMLVSLGVVFLILSFMWIIIGRLETQGKLREAMAT
ncbi:MAG: phosphate-starvation-inducible PsiE family protein [Desulfurococcales archaeon]|nr:phosphate-starvation-inducible PsiE family protein [Desulfurococcales archaeon]